MESDKLLSGSRESHGAIEKGKAVEEHDATSHGGGGKSIGYIGSLAIAVNSLAGPAVLQLPSQYQLSGLIPTTTCLVAVAILSYYCSMHTANVVSQVPGNRSFDKVVEFSDPFRIFWGETAYKATQILFFLCTACLNVAAIVDTAEVVDSFLGLHYTSYGWNAASNEIQAWSHVPCTRKQVKQGHCDPFADEDVYGDYLLTLGYVLTAAVFLPICLMDLKENTNWQILGFGILLSVSGYFCYSFSAYGFNFHNVSWWGHQWGGMLGVILFNFSLVLAIPAWLHEKKETVGVRQVVAHSTILSTIIYILVGALGAFAIPKVNLNMLSPIVSGAFGSGVQIAGSIFAFFIIGLDIPLFSVLTRYNLTHSGLCSERTANWLVVWIPWGMSWLIYQGDAIGDLLDWGGVLLTSAAAFLLPLYLALRVLVSTDAEGSVNIYGMTLSRRAQIVILYVLLFVAAVSVAVAIAGQVMAEEARYNYTQSPGYLNGTMAATLAMVENLNGPPMVHLIGAQLRGVLP